MKKIITIGCELASDDISFERISSHASLLDYDIAIFKPNFDDLLYTQTKHNGRPCLSDSSSLLVREATQHWRAEITQAASAGKTVIVFLSELKSFYIATGEVEYSGTGRNSRANRLVEGYDNYVSIPVSLSPVKASGSSIKLATNFEILTPYWSQFSEKANYKVLISPPKGTTALLTKSGDRAVGALIRDAKSAGSILLLPDMDLEPDEFFEESDAGDYEWTAEAVQFCAGFVAAILALDQGLRSANEATPEPSWATDPAYELPTETEMRSELILAERDLQEAQQRKEQIVVRLAEAGRLRALLFEKGPSLERAIVEALLLLGFKAAPYRDAKSEFDVVFESAEGRLLGEAEGKDNKPVNIDKLRQLALNIHEDLERDEVSNPAKGVLFGNAHRLVAPPDRPDNFTEKCISAARGASIALVKTSDLYAAAQYLSSGPDNEYALACRKALVSEVGLVSLPQPPTTRTTTSVTEAQ